MTGGNDRVLPSKLLARQQPSGASIRQLRAFLSVAKNGSFRAGAKSLLLTQSAVSQAVQQLENALQVALFDHSSRTMRLTGLGEEFISIAERLVKDFDTTMSDLAAAGRQERGHVEIACPTSLASEILMPILQELQQSHPHITLALREDDGDIAQKLLLDGAVDFAVTGNWQPRPGLSFRPLLSDPCCLVMPRTHRLSRARSIALDQVADERFIRSLSGTVSRLLFDRVMSEAGRDLRIACEVGHLLTLMLMVERKLGLTILPRLAADLHRGIDVSVVPLSRPAVERQVGLMRREHRPLRPVARLVVDRILQRYPEAAPRGAA